MNIVKESKLPVLLAELKSNDQVKVNEYTSLLATVSDKIAKDWKLPLAKLVINSYVRSNGLDENSYTSYLYQDQKLAVAYSVPEHVKDSFDRTFLCRSPDYWKQLPAREKAITSPVDTLNKEMRFEIVMLK
ncbi:hypothetical protein [Pontibacter ummariensis]|nr:hypothetical protein [Pontibacter ummariensis]